MKYFIDFEATQFSNEIIEIGCVREDGCTFSSYVNATKKITPFITNLTGITQEMVDAAPSSDEVFSKFYDWLCQDGENIEFYCYGNSDIDFVKKNLTKTTNFKAQAALSMIGMALNDYAITVKKHFGLIRPIALIKVFAYYRGEESIAQAHDALEDALYLKEVAEKVEAEGAIEECPFPDYQQQTVKKLAKVIETVPVPQNKPYITRIRAKKVVEVYDSLEDAVNWAMNHLPNKTNVDEVVPKNVAKKLRHSSGHGTVYLNYKWKFHGNVGLLDPNFKFTKTEKEEM